MKLIVGFLTYNESSAKYLEEFLVSLAGALNFLDRSEFKIFARDNSDALNPKNKLFIDEFNASHNNLIEYSTENNNFGFGVSFNVLISKAISSQAEYFLILNPDMILDYKAVQNLVRALDENKSFSAASPKIYYWDFLNNIKTNKIDSLGITVRPGLRFSNLGQGFDDNGQFDNGDIIGPSGASGLFRLADLERIVELGVNGKRQYFDERFFMYKEDCDLAYRLYLAGLKTVIVPEALIYHDRSSGSGKQNVFKKITNRFRISRQIRAWSLQNQNILYYKYWKNQNFVNKFLIIFWFLSSLVFSLILEQFNLKTYFKKL